MAQGDVRITIVGNSTRDPETRQVGDNQVTRISVAVSERKFDRDTNTWVDGEPAYYDVSAWRDLGANVAKSVSTGTRVVVHGVLKQRSYEKDGQKRTAYEIEADEVGLSLRFGTGTITKSQSNHTQQNRQQQARQQPQQASQPSNTWDPNTPF